MAERNGEVTRLRCLPAPVVLLPLPCTPSPLRTGPIGPRRGIRSDRPARPKATYARSVDGDPGLGSDAAPEARSSSSTHVQRRW